MPTPERIYEVTVRGISLLMMLLGAAILISTLIAGGGPLSIGVLLGLVFGAVGAGRLYIATRGRK